MTEIVEMVAVAVAAPHTKQDCPFCKPQEEVNKKNFLHPDYNEDTAADNDTDNSSGTLAKNLGSRPQDARGKVPAILKGEKAPIHDMEFSRADSRTWHQWVYDAGLIPVMYGAHHLIPGNASLAKSALYQNKWMGPVDNGADRMNIGYNVNGANNGTWLPGNYAVKGWSAKESEFQKAYALLAIHDTKRPFHDAHKDYSDTVLGTLDELNKLMEKMKNSGCPMCKEGGKEGDPPYHLNARLNAISRWLRDNLNVSAGTWRNNIITSKWCKIYKKEIKGKAAGDIESEFEKLRNQKPENT